MQRLPLFDDLTEYNDKWIILRLDDDDKMKYMYSHNHHKINGNETAEYIEPHILHKRELKKILNLRHMLDRMYMASITDVQYFPDIDLLQIYYQMHRMFYYICFIFLS